MGYQPRIKSPKRAIHEYRKPLREKRKDRKRIHRRDGRPISEEKHTATQREISELTLKQLHTLGRQKFGSSPFCEHFNRWLANVEAVLGEFESHPNIKADEEFVKERAQTLAVIKLQLEKRRQKEASLDQEITNLSYYKSRLKQIDKEYSTIMAAFRNRKRQELKPLYATIDELKREQDRVIRVKRGFLRGIFGNDREHKEIAIGQELENKNRELEMILLALSAEKNKLREEFEQRRQPVLDQIKNFRKIMRSMETDGSLEERWFACEALIDVVNNFLQRKATQPSEGPN
jgi:hypothetical protein